MSTKLLPYCFYREKKSSATNYTTDKIRQLQPGRETGLGFKSVSGSPGPTWLCSVSRGQSAMDTRKASTSSIASSIAYSYFSIDTSEKEEAQQSGIIEHGSFHLLSIDRVKIELKNCLKNHFSQLFGRQTKCFMAFPIQSRVNS